MTLTPKQDMIVSLMQDGYNLYTGASETNGRQYFMIASTHNNGMGNTYFRADVFSWLLSNEFIYQQPNHPFDWVLTDIGEQYNCKYKHNKTNRMTTPTMTKEQILENIPIDTKNDVNHTTKEVLQAMEEYAQQQLSAERERAGKLVEALRKTMRVIEDYEGELSLGYISANQTINDYDTATKES